MLLLPMPFGSRQLRSVHASRGGQHLLIQTNYFKQDRLSSMPPEILHLIYEHLHVSMRDDEDYKRASNLNRPISRQFRIYEQIALFRSISVRTDALSDLVQILEQNPQLAELIRHLVLNPPRGRQLRPQMADLTGRLLLLCASGLLHLVCNDFYISETVVLPRMNEFIALKTSDLVYSAYYNTSSNLLHLLAAPQLDKVELKIERYGETAPLPGRAGSPTLPRTRRALAEIRIQGEFCLLSRPRFHRSCATID